MAEKTGSQAREVGIVVASIILTMSGSNALETFYLTDFCNDKFSLQDHKVKAFILVLTRNATYSPNMRCDMDVIADSGYRLIFDFTEINLYDCQDYADVYEWRIDEYRGLNPEICDKVPSPPLVTNGGHGMIGFFSDIEGEGRGFKVIITAFHTGDCDKTEFRCTNGRCIDKSLNCSGYDNCGDNSNNLTCIDGATKTIFTVIFGVISIITLICFFGIFLSWRRAHGRFFDVNSSNGSGCPNCPSLPNCPSFQSRPKCPRLPRCPKIPSPSFPRCFRRDSEPQPISSSDTRMSSIEPVLPSTTQITSNDPTPFSPTAPSFYPRGAGATYSDPPPTYDDLPPPRYEDVVQKTE